jgi:5-methylcytosine-specific restriction enzyme subunit McrC
MAIYSILEFGTITAKNDTINGKRQNSVQVPSKTFENLWDFSLEVQANVDESNRVFDLFTRGGRKVIKAKNFVGVIETKNGDTIEILPKIQGTSSIKESKSIFLQMLKVLQNFNSLSFQNAQLDSIDNFPILELFISNYINESEQIILNGLRKGYSKKESNLKYLKGNILFKDHIKKNITNKTMFYVRHSEFSANISINRILKTTLLKLEYLTNSHYNKIKIKKILDLLEEVPSSQNINSDLNSSKNTNRFFLNYSRILKWSEIFLLNKGLTNFSGDTINQALLFPMEKVFESFVAYQIRKHSNGVRVSTQDKKYHLVEKYIDKPKYKLQPDIVASFSDKCIIIDTKWKILDERSSSLAIKQSDMYQLYAYGRKYLKGFAEPVLFLIYPYHENFTTQSETFFYEKVGNFWLKLYARPFDLRGNYKAQVINLLEFLDCVKEA